MSQHDIQTCNESRGEEWLALVEYSIKSGLSLSTIRRKIKSNSIPFRLEKGKYFIQYCSEGFPVSNPVLLKSNPKLELVSNYKPVPVQKEMPQSSNFSDEEKLHRELHEKNQIIARLEKRNYDLECKMDELMLLVQALEEKYEVRY